MTKIVNLKEYDLTLSYSFGYSQRPCTGHIFECIEYFMILKNHMSVAILIGDCVDFEDILGKIINKYNFTNDELMEIQDAIHVADNPNIVMGNKLLLVDGNFKRLKDKFIKFKEFYCFPCGVRDAKDYPDYVTILGDSRIYDFTDINYRKKMLIDRFNELEYNTGQIYDYMLYVTAGPRELSIQQIKNIINKYRIKDETFMILTDYDINLGKDYSFVDVKQAPIENLFNFKTYIYTTIERKFDCSPRFIVECIHFNKNVVFELDYDMEEDKGLYYRYSDLENIDSIKLTENDEIISILK